MYKLELDKARLSVYITGLDSSIKLIANRLAQQNSALALRELLPKLIELNNELSGLDKLIDDTDSVENELNKVSMEQKLREEITKSLQNGATTDQLSTLQ